MRCQAWRRVLLEDGSYDPTTNLTIWGTGQPVPMFDPNIAPADTSSPTRRSETSVTKMKWYFQYTAGVHSSMTRLAFNQLIDTKINGQDRKDSRTSAAMGHMLLDRTVSLCNRSNMPRPRRRQGKMTLDPPDFQVA